MKKYFLQFSLVLATGLILLAGCADQKVDQSITAASRPKGKDLEVVWELKANGFKGGKALTAFSIKNNSAGTLGTNWAIYFHQPRTIDTASFDDRFTIDHINGDYFKLQPTDSFVGVPAGEKTSFEYLNDAWFLKAVDAPNGIYIVFTDDKGNEFEPEVVGSVTVLPLSSEDSLAIDGSSFLQIPTSTSIYAQNAMLDSLSKEGLCPITPSPLFYKAKEGQFELLKGAVVSFDQEIEAEANFLVEKLGADFGLALKLGGENPAVELKLDTTLNVDGKTSEVYTLTVSEDVITILGSDLAGVFYGVQSLRALCPVSAYQGKQEKISLPLASVKDAPRFAYRGMHLDVVRNFQKKEAVLKLIDIMAFYKLNKFHFHITDDEGWRLEIEGLPELTSVGSKRGHTTDESDKLNPAYGSGPFSSDDSNGSGYYTKADFIEILKYAKARHIEVIPEIDFPGHARAAIISMKARHKRLISEGKKEEAMKYVLHDANDSSEYKSIQNYKDNVICVCQESTYKFIGKVVDEVANLYSEAGLVLKTVHTGGDEVPHPDGNKKDAGVWAKSPICRSFLDTTEKYQKPEELFYYFVDRFSSILADKNITTAGWEEIGLKKELNEEEDLVPVVNEEFLSKNFTPYIWNTVWTWGAEDRAYQLANAGYKVVLSNVNNLYFDLAYDKDPNDPGYYWGGFVDTKKAWNFIPLDFYKEEIVDRWGNALPDSVSKQAEKERLTPEGVQNVLGIQGQLWAETVMGSDMMEYYVFPKIFGLVERAWAKDPAWASIENTEARKLKIDQDYALFAAKLGYFELQRLNYTNGGLNYRVSPAGAIVKGGMLYANTEFPGFNIYYTLDGSEPTQKSTLYTSPVKLPAGKEVKLKVFSVSGHPSKTTVLK